MQRLSNSTGWEGCLGHVLALPAKIGVTSNTNPERRASALMLLGERQSASKKRKF